MPHLGIDNPQQVLGFHGDRLGPKAAVEHRLLSSQDPFVHEGLEVEKRAKWMDRSDEKTEPLLDHSGIFELTFLTDKGSDGFHVEFEVSRDVDLVVLLGLFTTEDER